MFNHGTATFKDDQYFKELRVQNKNGIITAYLPEQNIFAVHFGGPEWITFNWTEEEFLEKFEVELNEGPQPL
jgi:hypothetical protein